MARSKEVSLFLKNKTWQIRFHREPGGPRIKRSTQTHNKNEAISIQKQIEALIANPNIKVDPLAYEIFFGHPPLLKNPEAAKMLQKRFEINDDDSYVIASLADELYNKNILLYELQEEVRKLNLEKEALLQDTLTYRLQLAKSCPTLEDALQEFYDKEISGIAKRGQSEYKRVLDDFKDTRETSKVSLISDNAIKDFLEDSADDHDKPNYRFNYNRTYIFRFFKWAASKYKFLNPLLSIPKKEAEQKEDIHWHELNHVLKVIENEKEDYWKRLIATLLYTGLSAHELRGIRKSDIIETTVKKGKKNKLVKYIYVTPHEGRTLKRIKRKRHVMVSKALEPYINEQLKTSGKYLFPPIVGKSSIWNSDTFSDYLNRHLPTDMNALSLRRTFGSLLLRSGYSPYEVSVAMGNSEDIVKQHYARLLANEIDTNFNKRLEINLRLKGA